MLGRTEFVEIPGADHNDPIWEVPAYAPRMKAFLGL
jgi:hypothetical protein